MLSDSEKAVFKGLMALKNKDYPSASGFFRTAENQFADSIEFLILKETTDLLLAVKEEIVELEKESVRT